MRQIMANVDAERDRQDEKWGPQNHSPFAWITILAEEFGEAAKAVLEGKEIDYHKEMIQVAAVACAAVESYERNRDLEGVPGIASLQLENAGLRMEISRLRGANDKLTKNLASVREVGIGGISDLEGKLKAATDMIAKMSQALGLLSTLKPGMKVNEVDPLGMAQEIVAEMRERSRAVAWWRSRNEEDIRRLIVADDRMTVALSLWREVRDHLSPQANPKKVQLDDVLTRPPLAGCDCRFASLEARFNCTDASGLCKACGRKVPCG